MNYLFMYKIEIRFDESLSEAELKKLGDKMDKVFASKKIKIVDKKIGSRIYYDDETQYDYGYNAMWEALDVVRKTFEIRKHIKSAYWYNIIRGERDDLLEIF